jgi:tetratricopeptide (TPR) repeat protein
LELSILGLPFLHVAVFKEPVSKEVVTKAAYSRTACSLLLLISALLVAGCATPLSQSDTSAAAKPAMPAMDTAELQTADFPPQVLYQLLVAELAGQRGEIGVAVANYLAAAKASQDPQVAERAARIAIYAQALDQGLEASELWVKLAPNDADARQVLAPLLLAFGRDAEAVTHYQRYIALSADKPDRGFLQIAGQLARDKNPPVALAVMDKLVAGQSDNPYAWLGHSQLALQQAKLDVAMDSVNKALKLKPHWASAVVVRAHILALQGDKEAALAYLEAQRDDGLGDDPMVGLSYARLLTEDKQLEKARQEFERLAEREPRNVEVHYAAGVLALQLNDLDKAVLRFNQVLRLGQRTLEANYYLGRVFEQKNEPETALKHYFAVRHGEYYLSAQSRAASLLAEQGKLDQALDHLHSLQVANDQEQVRLYLVEGELLSKAGQYQQAVDFFTSKLETMPNDTALRYARALVAEKADRLDMTESDLRIIIEREPNNAQALNALGFTLADRTDRLEEALGFIERALQVEPEDAAIIDSMGWVQFRMGNNAKAVEQLRKALSLVEDPEIAAHLGEVLWKMGNKSDALNVLESALVAHPKHKALMDAMKRLGL